MKGEWVTVQGIGYKMVPHNFADVVVGKRTCSNCGLMALNNTFSQWAVKKGCMNALHPEYKRMRRG